MAKLSAQDLDQLKQYVSGEGGQGGPEVVRKFLEAYETDQDRVRVGVAVIVRRGSMVLLGKRKGGRGHGTWALPGGHLEYKEGVAECAEREILEETSLHIHDLKEGPYVNNFFGEDGRHYITLFVTAKVGNGAQAELMEPDKCFEWRWCDKGSLPEPLFPPLKSYLDRFDLFEVMEK